jgi:hypothetical protein
MMPAPKTPGAPARFSLVKVGLQGVRDAKLKPMIAAQRAALSRATSCGERERRRVRSHQRCARLLARAPVRDLDPDRRGAGFDVRARLPRYEQVFVVSIPHVARVCALRERFQLP